MQIKDIARIAGVAPSTVSRVINNSGYVSTEVRERVERIITETGYVPNSVAKSLKGKKTNVIGFIIPQLSSESMSKIAEGASEECEKNNYDILLANTGLKAERELKYLKTLNQRQIDGIIMMSVKLSAEHKKLIDELRIPVVVIGQKQEGLCCITHDDFRAAYDMTEMLINKGKRNIAMINISLDDDSVRKDRLNGYIKALDRHGIAFTSQLTAFGDFSVSAGHECMKEIWEKSDTKPDAVFCVSDKIAFGAIQFLKKSGINCPDQCAVAGIGNNSISEYSVPSITTAEYYHRELGRKAAEILFRSVEAGSAPQGIHYIDYKIIERGST